jgi:hypothetical protein
MAESWIMSRRERERMLFQWSQPLFAASSEAATEEFCRADIRTPRSEAIPHDGNGERALIQTSMYGLQDLTVHRASGTVTAEEILHKIAVYYLTETPAQKILWDFTAAAVKDISREDLRRIARTGKEYAVRRKGGRTALVFSTEVEYGLGRMFEAFAIIEEFPFEIRSFRSIESAGQWLGIEGALAIHYCHSDESLYRAFPARHRKAV